MVNRPLLLVQKMSALQQDESESAVSTTLQYWVAFAMSKWGNMTVCYLVGSGRLAMYIMLQLSLNEPATAITDLFGSGVHALPFHAIRSSVRFRHSPDCLHDAHLEWCLSCVFL